MGNLHRFKYCPMQPLGEDGRMVTGSREHIALSRKAACEGMVLLKNENSFLPLGKGRKVALFGKGSVDYVKGGGGSGDVTVAYVHNLCDGMEEKAAEGKVAFFAPLHEFYRRNVEQQRKDGKQPGYTVEPEVPQDLLRDAAEFADTAIISICRFSSEGYDRKGELNDGDFYLSLEEQKMVSQVSSCFENIVVVLNVGGMVDTSWFVHNEKVKSVLLAWQGGMEGGMAEADILCGDVNPSGKLTDTFASAFDDYPSSSNFNESEDYVCYTDDIFVGYRYFETIPGAAEKVNYPFGFGLSYTTFEMEQAGFEADDDAITVSVRVTNTGMVAGKEVIQVYSNAPKGYLETPKLELRAFRKTRLLNPKESELLTIQFPVTEMASYDEKKASYVLLKGAYKILAGNCVRALVEVGQHLIEENRVTQELKNRCVPSKLPSRMKADGTYEPLETKEYAPRRDDSDLPPCQANKWWAEYILPNMRECEPPVQRMNLEGVIRGEITLDEFINQLSDDELLTLVGGTHNRGVADTRGIGGLDYLGIPAVMTADGPAGLRLYKDRGVTTTAWPIATMLACSWDPDVLYQVGKAAAREVLENNIGIWLTPAINIHRSPLCGRNFEYYAEDPLVAGKLASAMIQGIQSQNVVATVKHFCCNNKETNRFASDSRVSERALREIYLKGFQLAVTEGGVWAVMTAYNLLNGIYTSENKELLTGILREEWGFEGLVMTDWSNWAEQYREVLAGNNVRMPFGSPVRLRKALNLGLITRMELVLNARQILLCILRLC